VAANPRVLFEKCDVCETLQRSSTMSDIYLRSRHGVPFAARVCRRCASPQLTYMAGHFALNQVDVPRILGFAFGLIIAILNVAFGSLVGGQLGLWIVMAGIMAGASISVAFAMSMISPQGLTA